MPPTLHEYSVLLASAGSSVCPDITGSRILGAWVRRGIHEPAGNKDTRVSPRANTLQGQLLGQIRSSGAPCHLAADGCSILDLAIPLEKTSSVMVFSVPFSICS